MKYIVFTKKLKETTVHIPVIFPAMLVHADVAKMLTCDIGPLAGYVADSAGECNTFRLEGWQCAGKSETLGLESDPARDSELIQMADYGGLMW